MPRFASLRRRAVAPVPGETSSYLLGFARHVRYRATPSFRKRGIKWGRVSTGDSGCGRMGLMAARR